MSTGTRQGPVGDDAAAATLQTTLLRLGYEVAASTSSGGEAVTLAASMAPDLVLMHPLLGRA